MAKTADTIAIYSRKSRYTGKGESIGNQIDLCREYIRTHYGDAAAEHAVVFEDEGFSGGNLNRPDFKKMMTAAKERKFKAIVVYRLDRISRNISDFSSLIEELGRQGIKTKTGRSFTRFSIKSILQNPVYLIADKDAYQYFVDNEAELFAPESGKKREPERPALRLLFYRPSPWHSSKRSVRAGGSSPVARYCSKPRACPASG